MPDRHIEIREAAWLARVNDDTVRGWVRAGGLPVDSAGRIDWGDLSEMCRAKSRPPPLPTAALRLTASDWQAAFGTDRKADAPEVRSSSLLRRTVRELSIALTHAHGEVAALQRALGMALDYGEANEVAHFPQLASDDEPPVEE